MSTPGAQNVKYSVQGSTGNEKIRADSTLSPFDSEVCPLCFSNEKQKSSKYPQSLKRISLSHFIILLLIANL